MEMSILNQAWKAVVNQIDPKTLITGTVLDVRYWEEEPVIEVDLHLPYANMDQWIDVQLIRVKVDDDCFYDYTPFGWDADTATCSLLLNVGHDGPGTVWAKHLKTGEQVEYIKISSTFQSPHPTNLVVAIGDECSLGHILAMQQLALPLTRFDGALILDNPKTAKLFKAYFRSPLNIVKNVDELIKWLINQNYCSLHSCFYLAGNDVMVSNLNSFLKSLGYTFIKSQKFNS